MYNLLISKFKAALTDRNVELKLISAFSVILFITFSTLFVNIFLWQFWLVYAISILFELIAGLVSAHCIFFAATKKKLNYKIKDFFRIKTVWIGVRKVQQQDSIILLSIIKEIGIDTMSKVQEAIRHFQLLLSNKQNKGFDVIPIVSVALPISIAIYEAIKTNLVILIVLLFLTIILSLFLCLAGKCIYKGVYYSLSEYALYERIEMALSEIYMKELITQ